MKKKENLSEGYKISKIPLDIFMKPAIILRASGFGLRASGFGLRASGFGLRASGDF
jgi:hypothetical protein